jgi:small subunit ribosomal protein S8
MTDPISDLLTRLRNANQVEKTVILVPYSRVKADIVRVLKKEGFIDDFKVEKGEKHMQIQVTLRGVGEQRAITGLKKISKPGRREYVPATKIPKVIRGGLGISILSTSKGIMTGREAKKEKVGGEVLCFVW